MRNYVEDYTLARIQKRLKAIDLLVELKRKTPEYIVHKQIAEYLNTFLIGYFHTIENSNQQGGSSGAIKQGRLKALGAKTGFPDMIVFSSGRTLCLEIKRYGEKARERQIEVHETLAKHGIPTEVVHSIDEVKKALKKHNIPTRESL